MTQPWNYLPPSVRRLPFTISPVSSAAQLQRVLAIRSAAYGRHAYKAALRQSLPQPDAIDLAGHSTTLVAVCKQTGGVLGTVRLTCSTDGPVDLPENTPDDDCLHDVFSYVDRFAVDSSEDATLVASALMKATWLWSRGRGAQWLVALALPPLARVYRRRGGLVVRAGGTPVLMEKYHDEPYVLMAATLDEAFARVREENIEYHVDFVDRVHPDICVHGTSIPWSQLPRQALALVPAAEEA